MRPPSANAADRFIATHGDGDDVYYGGDGIDTLDFSAFTSAVEVALGGRPTGHVSGAQTGDDTISTIENAVGGNDNLRGSGGDDNRLDGGAGVDFLFGAGGRDILIGGPAMTP